ncbi:MAG TPA: hypothetical protein VJ506_03685 [Candidatus Limnocylindrales bacterium]|nr:hypothetical protein [Candidatus Limnocylindrales bacterium]
MVAPATHPAPSLLELMEELVATIELRDASDPDAPAWEAERRIARLEAELAACVRSGEAERIDQAGPPEEAAAGVV